MKTGKANDVWKPRSPGEHRDRPDGHPFELRRRTDLRSPSTVPGKKVELRHLLEELFRSRAEREPRASAPTQPKMKAPISVGLTCLPIAAPLSWPPAEGKKGNELVAGVSFRLGPSLRLRQSGRPSARHGPRPFASFPTRCWSWQRGSGAYCRAPPSAPHWLSTSLFLGLPLAGLIMRLTPSKLLQHLRQRPCPEALRAQPAHCVRRDGRRRRPRSAGRLPARHARFPRQACRGARRPADGAAAHGRRLRAADGVRACGARRAACSTRSASRSRSPPARSSWRRCSWRSPFFVGRRAPGSPPSTPATSTPRPRCAPPSRARSSTSCSRSARARSSPAPA